LCAYVCECAIADKKAKTKIDIDQDRRKADRERHVQLPGVPPPPHRWEKDAVTKACVASF
jgi:hypothetical protein